MAALPGQRLMVCLTPGRWPWPALTGARRCRYNARVTQYEPTKGYHVRVPGLDAVSDEWVDASRLRPRTRTPHGAAAEAAARSPGSRASALSVDGSPAPLRQMRLRQEKRQAAAAARGAPSSFAASPVRRPPALCAAQPSRPA